MTRSTNSSSMWLSRALEPRSPSSFPAFSLPVISSIDSVEMSSSSSIDTTSSLYRGRATRRYFATTFASGSGSPRMASLCTMLDKRRAKSSTDSPSLKLICSYSTRRFWAVDLRTRSSPIRIVQIASHASFAVAFVASVGTISSGTPEQIASSAERSSWKSASSSSIASHRHLACSFSFISNDHES